MKATSNGRMITADTALSDCTTEARLARCEDRAAVAEILCHYTRCVDTDDVEGIASCFTEDAQFFGADEARPIKTRATIEKAYRHFADAGLATSAHFVTNEQIMFASADEAFVFAYFHAHKTYCDQRVPELTVGGYEVRAVRDDDGEWRMRTFKIFITWQGDAADARPGCDGATDEAPARCAENRGRIWPPAPEKSRAGIEPWHPQP